MLFLDAEEAEVFVLILRVKEEDGILRDDELILDVNTRRILLDVEDSSRNSSSSETNSLMISSSLSTHCPPPTC